MLNPAAIPPKTRRHLSFDPLIRQLRLRAKQLSETCNGQGCSYSVADAVMSAMALFALKGPSLLAFQERRNDANMKNIFRILQVPSDTQMREILATCPDDEVRDGSLAIEHATKACELIEWSSASYLGSLAAAHAEARDSESAVEYLRKAIDIVADDGQKQRFEARLELYSTGQPFRDGVPRP